MFYREFIFYISWIGEKLGGYSVSIKFLLIAC